MAAHYSLLYGHQWGTFLKLSATLTCGCTTVKPQYQTTGPPAARLVHLYTFLKNSDPADLKTCLHYTTLTNNPETCLLTSTLIHYRTPDNLHTCCVSAPTTYATQNCKTSLSWIQALGNALRVFILSIPFLSQKGSHWFMNSVQAQGHWSLFVYYIYIYFFLQNIVDLLVTKFSLLLAVYRNVNRSAGELCAAANITYGALFWAGIGRFFHKLRSTGSKFVLYEWEFCWKCNHAL